MKKKSFNFPCEILKWPKGVFPRQDIKTGGQLNGDPFDYINWKQLLTLSGLSFQINVRAELGGGAILPPKGFV